jgi:hypothetical protein
MPALTADRDTLRRDGVDYEWPMAAATVGFAGAIACLNSSGLLTRGATSTTLKAVGVFKERADNSAGAASAIKGKVRRGVFRFNNSAAGDAITLADVNSNCFIVDDNTVAKTNGSSTRSIAGVIDDVDASGVWVRF